ncbi:MAG: flavin reductase family protein [Flavobacteriales bacterium]|jgi:flavin reductase (DIM6/NTAB) family NADH-FMN oxidoreductase RutF|nr:flavin reductase family protein [Flavobacteriales bacterium]NCF96027.1 flavin reductase family protein [Bacteroidota bacterium]MBT3572421.1 flavin reductase family protein [Flavobacteriales bacterium]MBT3677574.1 flavin reductase family protein [Flavobacteriales bacterium]MBT3739548.1 flavin reductase family protein [Flavobacteriales bacterium]
MITIDPQVISTQDLQRTLQFAVGPRPIALVSTINDDGQVNLSPFSFYNIFSTNPPILVFSPARRVRDNSTKHSLENVIATGEAVIHSVSFDMVQQVSLSSTEYGKGVNEFIKAGFTEVPSDLVAPPRVAEAAVAMECKVLDVIALGDQGGAGNLVMCEIKRIHLSESVLDEEGRLDQDKLDLVARLGGDWYSRSNADALFEVEKPLRTIGIGIDALPKALRQSNILTGNDLAKLGNVERIQAYNETIMEQPRIQAIFDDNRDAMERREAIHIYAKELLDEDQINDAWAVLLIDGLNSQPTTINS